MDLCEAALHAILPPESPERNRLDALLAKGVVLGTKHAVYCHMEEKGVLATKDRDILAEHLIEEQDTLLKERHKVERGLKDPQDPAAGSPAAASLTARVGAEGDPETPMAC